MIPARWKPASRFIWFIIMIVELTKRSGRKMKIQTRVNLRQGFGQWYNFQKNKSPDFICTPFFKTFCPIISYHVLRCIVCEIAYLHFYVICLYLCWSIFIHHSSPLQFFKACDRPMDVLLHCSAVCSCVEFILTVNAQMHLTKQE